MEVEIDMGASATPTWRSVVVGIAYLAVVVFIIIFCATQADSFDEYSQYWGLFATIVGVVTGAVPSFFFHSQAQAAEQRASEAQDQARKAAARAETLAGMAPPEVVAAARATRPDAFS